MGAQLACDATGCILKISAMLLTSTHVLPTTTALLYDDYVRDHMHAPLECSLGARERADSVVLFRVRRCCCRRAEGWPGASGRGHSSGCEWPGEYCVAGRGPCGRRCRAGVLSPRRGEHCAVAWLGLWHGERKQRVGRGGERHLKGGQVPRASVAVCDSQVELNGDRARAVRKHVACVSPLPPPVPFSSPLSSPLPVFSPPFRVPHSSCARVRPTVPTMPPAASSRSSILKGAWRPTKIMNMRDLSRDDDFLSHLLVEKLGTGGFPLVVHKMDPSRRLPKTDPEELMQIVRRVSASLFPLPLPMTSHPSSRPFPPHSTRSLSPQRAQTRRPSVRPLISSYRAFPTSQTTPSSPLTAYTLPDSLRFVTTFEPTPRSRSTRSPRMHFIANPIARRR